MDSLCYVGISFYSFSFTALLLLVIANYTQRSILLLTVSNQSRLTAVEKEDYFHHFLADRPLERSTCAVFIQYEWDGRNGS